VPFSDLPPSEAALVWRTADRSPKIEAFVRAATDVLARHPESDHGRRELASQRGLARALA